MGRGKTHLAAAIANLVLEKGGTVIYRRAVDLFELIRQYRYEENRQKLDEMMEQLRSCDLLVIDDLGAERTTEFVVEQLVVLLEDRNYRNKPWVITSNLNLNEITSTYNDRPQTGFWIKRYCLSWKCPTACGCRMPADAWTPFNRTNANADEKNTALYAVLLSKGLYSVSGS